MRLTSAFAATALAFALTAAPAFAQTSPSDDEAGVRAALQHYLNGHATGDPEEFRKAFHPDARMTFVREGRITITPISEYIARATGKPAADEAKRVRRITNVEVVGNAAVGRIELDYPAVFFVDYMTLLKEDGRWVIIAKSFHSTPKGR